MGEDMAAKINTPEFRAQLDRARIKASTNARLKGLSELTIVRGDTAFGGSNNKLTGPDGSVFYFNNSNSKLRQSEEYKKLKQKFDKEVKELKEKMEKQEKKEKPEQLELKEQ